jgi:hypothetical protein
MRKRKITCATGFRIVRELGKKPRYAVVTASGPKWTKNRDEATRLPASEARELHAALSGEGDMATIELA